MSSTSMRISTELNDRYNRLAETTGRLEYEYKILQQVEDWRAGRLETYSLDEVRAHCGLAD